MKTINTLLSVFLFTAFATPAFGAGFTSTDRSVVAMGTGGAGAARAEDAGANVYNPAAAAMTPGLWASAGIVLVSPTLEATGPGWSAQTEGSPVTPPMLHVRYGFGDLAFGASLAVPFGSRVAWPSTWEGRFELVEAKMRTAAKSELRMRSSGKSRIILPGIIAFLSPDCARSPAVE